MGSVMSECEFIPLQQAIITIIHGTQNRSLPREHFEAYLFNQMDEMSQTDKLIQPRTDYIDAYEWLLANLYRVAGIQLYDDGEIRLNISPGEIKDNKKCIYFLESPISNRNLDSVLYDELESIMLNGI